MVMMLENIMDTLTPTYPERVREPDTRTSCQEHQIPSRGGTEYQETEVLKTVAYACPPLLLSV